MKRKLEVEHTEEQICLELGVQTQNMKTVTIDDN